MSLNESIVEDATLECFGERSRFARTLTSAISSRTLATPRSLDFSQLLSSEFGGLGLG